MKTVIMAGGKGTRISSVASDIPKPMIKIDGVPVLEREICCLREQGFTGKQFDEQIKKFFLSYVQIWKEESERSLEELKKLHDMKNSHSLNHVRVNGMMRLQDDWYRLYDVKPTDKLYLAPEQRVKIW